MDSLNLEALLGGRKTRKASKPTKTIRRHRGGALPELLVDTPENLTKSLGTIKDAVSKPEGYALDDIDKIVAVLRAALEANLPKSGTSSSDPNATNATNSSDPNATNPAVGGKGKKSTKLNRK